MEVVGLRPRAGHLNEGRCSREDRHSHESRHFRAGRMMAAWIDECWRRSRRHFQKGIQRKGDRDGSVGRSRLLHSPTSWVDVKVGCDVWWRDSR